MRDKNKSLKVCPDKVSKIRLGWNFHEHCHIKKYSFTLQVMWAASPTIVWKMIKTKEVNFNNAYILNMSKSKIKYIVKKCQNQICWFSTRPFCICTHIQCLYTCSCMGVRVCTTQPHFLEFKNSTQRRFMHSNSTMDPLAWLPFSNEKLTIFSWNKRSEVIHSLAHGVRRSLWRPSVALPCLLTNECFPYL